LTFFENKRNRKNPDFVWIKMFDVFDKKQMYDSAITWKENASKD